MLGTEMKYRSLARGFALLIAFTGVIHEAVGSGQAQSRPLRLTTADEEVKP